MAIPELDTDGFLPQGIHNATMEELCERFGRFQTSDQRPMLARKLTEFVKDVSTTGLAESLIVDGSFVTAKDEPNDIDLVLVLRPNHNWSANLRPFEYNVLSRRMVRKHYAFDLFVSRAGAEELAEYTDFFQRIRTRPDRLKGIVRIVL